jgi:hypothetical protein
MREFVWMSKCGCTLHSSKNDLWNAVRISTSSHFPQFKADFPLSKDQIDKVALRFSYDMEHYTRNPWEGMKKIRKLFFYFDSMNETINIGKGASRSQRRADFLISGKFRQK